MNLAGEPLLEWWSSHRYLKGEMVRSRVETTRLLVEAINRMPSPPKMFVSASSVACYPSKNIGQQQQQQKPQRKTTTARAFSGGSSRFQQSNSSSTTTAPSNVSSSTITDESIVDDGVLGYDERYDGALADTFMGQLCQQWEQASLSLPKQTRRTILRFGHILYREKGFFPRVRNLYEFGENYRILFVVN
jgi:NAD dependent epimerase/dehydratase family enzyme